MKSSSTILVDWSVLKVNIIMFTIGLEERWDGQTPPHKTPSSIYIIPILIICGKCFRRKMRRFGRDPTKDYPEIGRNAPLHAADYPMIGFESFRNIDGYSDFFTQFIFQYESPSCLACHFLPWTTCNNMGQCVARRNLPGTELVDGPGASNQERIAAIRPSARTAANRCIRAPLPSSWRYSLV